MDGGLNGHQFSEVRTSKVHGEHAQRLLFEKILSLSALEK